MKDRFGGGVWRGFSSGEEGRMLSDRLVSLS